MRKRNRFNARDVLDAILVSSLDRVLLAKHLATLLHAGIVLDESLDILIEETASTHLKRVLLQVKRHVDAGERLADSLKSRPAVFSALFVEMVRVGEASGTLEENLLYVADQLEHDYDLRRKIRSAASYPIVVSVLAVSMAIGMSYFVLPKLIPIFSSLKVELPLSTRLVLGFSRFVVFWGWFFFPSMAVLFFLVRAYLRTPRIRPTWHQIIARLPVFGKISVNANLALCMRTLGILLKSGLPIVPALQITHASTRNENYRGLLRHVTREVARGLPLSESMRRAGLPRAVLPVIVPRVAAVGERTGTLAESLLSLADFYEREVDASTKNLSTIVEPALILVVGVGVLMIALSIVSVYKIIGNLQP